MSHNYHDSGKEKHKITSHLFAHKNKIKNKLLLNHVIKTNNNYSLISNVK